MADDDEKIEGNIYFDEIHFVPIPSQTNIYGLAKFVDSKRGRNVILLSSLKGEILSISSPNSFTTSCLHSCTVHFKNIQGSNHDNIVSIDAYNSTDGLIVGVTVIKAAHTDHQKQYLNLYYGQNLQKGSPLQLISDKCQIIELEFVPFHLYHTTLTSQKKSQEIVLLLSGNDDKIHVYGMNDSDQVMEIGLDEYFPEFVNVDNSVVWMDVCYDEINKKRISALACQNGLVKIAVVDSNDEILHQWTAIHDGPVSSVKIFTFKSGNSANSGESNDAVDDELKQSSLSYHVLVTGVIEPSVIYQDVLKCGISKMTMLPDSENYDCVLCSLIADVDWDTCNEILLGTYGQELLLYKLIIDESEETYEKVEGVLFWKKSFSQPLFAIDYIDVSDDGVKELVVASSKGLHVLQHRLSDVAEQFQNKFRSQNED